MSEHGPQISPGTLAGRQEDFLWLFRPVEQAIAGKLSQSRFCQGDGTSWRVQEFAAGGERSVRAWLWMGAAQDCVRFLIDPTRSAKATAKLFSDLRLGAFLICDRYAAYKKVSRLHEQSIILCFC